MKTSELMIEFNAWRDRFSVSDRLNYEALGALHHGKKFIQDKDVDVCREAIGFYLWVANHFANPKPEILSSEEMEKKARSVLATHFFKMPLDWSSWSYRDAISINAGNSPMPFLIGFLCCAREGIDQKLDWFRWNYLFVDDMIASDDEKQYKVDRTISTFLSRILWLILQKEQENPYFKKVRDAFLPHRTDIVTEVFLRAPWQLLPFRPGKGDVELFEVLQVELPEPYPRKFDAQVYDMCEGRLQNLPYIALPTRAEVLLILKSRP